MQLNQRCFASLNERFRGCVAASTSLGITEILDRAFLPPRNRPDVWNVPAHACECLHRCDNPHNQERYVHERLNDSPKKHQNSTNRRNRPKDQEQDSRDDAKQKPGTAEDDRLHGVETHKSVVLFDNIKNNTANQGNAGKCRCDVRR